jgi:3-oxoadipate enol-lactonase
MPFLPVEGSELYYELHGQPVGDAPAIVFAHGAGGNHMSWWQQVPVFASEYTCVTIDHRGWGQSKDRTGDGPLHFVDDLIALLDHLGIERTAVAAQSMGGWTALGTALRSPERVTRIVMSDTHGGTHGPEIPTWTAGPPPNPESGFHPACGERMQSEQPVLNFLYWQITNLNPPSEGRRILRDPKVAPSSETVRGLQVPALFIAGDEDIVIPPAVVEAAAALVPGAQFRTITRAGHSAHFERAAEWNATVQDFLRS